MCWSYIVRCNDFHSYVSPVGNLRPRQLFSSQTIIFIPDKNFCPRGVPGTFWLPNVFFATAACIFSTGEEQKVLRTWRVLYIFTWKCAFRHSGVQFCDIWTSKSAPKPSCFVHFHLKMCFSPQWRPILRHLNFKKCAEAVMFCTFSLPNALFATVACNFATSELQKVRRSRHVLYIFTSECAFAAACNFWFLLWAATSAPAALTGLLFDWPDTRIIEKTQHFATSLTFGADVSSFFLLSRYCIFFLLTSFCWLHYSTLLFNCPYCRKFLFKLPSISDIV